MEGLLFSTSTGCNNLSSDSDSSQSSSSSTKKLEPTPAQMLTMAIRKRRELYEQREPDYRRQLLHKAMIQSLCKTLGEQGRKTKRQRRRRHRSRSRSRNQPYEQDPTSMQDQDDEPGDGLFIEEESSGLESANGYNFSDNSPVSMVRQESSVGYYSADSYDYSGYVGYFASEAAFLAEASISCDEASREAAGSESEPTFTTLQPMVPHSDYKFPQVDSLTENSGVALESSRKRKYAEVNLEDPLELDALFGKVQRTSAPSQSASASTEVVPPLQEGIATFHHFWPSVGCAA